MQQEPLCSQAAGPFVCVTCLPLLSPLQNASGEVTDFLSFYTLPSTIMNHPTHKSLKAAYSFYNVHTQTPLLDLMSDALVLAKMVSSRRAGSGSGAVGAPLAGGCPLAGGLEAWRPPRPSAPVGNSPAIFSLQLRTRREQGHPHHRQALNLNLRISFMGFILTRGAARGGGKGFSSRFPSIRPGRLGCRGVSLEQLTVEQRGGTQASFALERPPACPCARQAVTVQSLPWESFQSSW